MGYGPQVVETLSKRLDTMQSLMPGYPIWYGEIGQDVELAKMVLDGASIQELKCYIIEEYCHLVEDDEEED